MLSLILVSAAATPPALKGQSSWPSYPSNTAISVTSGGNVGIGLTSPSRKLSVAGDVHFLSDWSVNALEILGNDAVPTRRGISLGADPDGSFNFYVHRWQSNASFNFREGISGATLLTVRGATGNVGIGTANPQYLLSVNGTVGTKEIVVTNTGWSDHVFEPGYRLKPLREVKAYIHANRHLPDIPSEAEVKARGVNLGDMQVKMLAKIEELTLHMIEAEERNSRLEQQNAELRSRITRLEKGAAPGYTPAK